ncbi:MAG: ion channel [Sphingomonas sp.]
MALDLILFLAGVVLAWLTLRDVFDTVVVPGGSRASLQVTRRVGIILLALYKLARGPKRGISSTFAPLVLVSSFSIWMSLLALAFGLMAFAARAAFRPSIGSFGDAVYQAGTALVTVGLSGHYPYGAARWIILAAGFCGLAVMTMAVTYLLEVQSSITRRDTGIIKLNTSAGDPPSALTLLERFGAIHNEAAIPADLQEARNWCATVRQSHSAHPSLTYFKSTSTGAGWPAALGTILDLALIAEHLIDDEGLYGPAVLLREEGARMARDLAQMARLQPKDVTTSEAELEQLMQRLASSGYRLRAHPNLLAMAKQREDHMSCVDALAEHLGSPTTVLVRQN